MRLKKILLATNNRNKVSEIKKVLGAKGRDVLCIEDVKGGLSVRENGRTFAENAIKKARAAAKKFGVTAISDDSGLCVKALKGAPGVRSARFVKPPVTSERLCKKLLKSMGNIAKSKRQAYFQCCVAISDPHGKCLVHSAKCSGTITFEMKGKKGFGYDPVFIPSGHSKTFAQMTGRQKNLLSHRGKAFKKLKGVLFGTKKGPFAKPD